MFNDAYNENTWRRVNPAIRSFVLGEVERQRWRIGTPDYRNRVEWMTDAWIWAVEEQRAGHVYPQVEHILFIAARIEPYENKNGFRGMGVRVGDRTAPDPREVPGLVNRLWRMIGEVEPITGVKDRPGGGQLTADEFYIEFEMIHPFADGNGRTGKILHNWLLGRLEDPVLVADYFGGGNP